MTCPNKYVVINHIPCVVLIFAITATNSSLHSTDTLIAIGKTDRLWSSFLCPTARSAAVSIPLGPNIYIQYSVRLCLSFVLTD
jgi:hypothetical protein